MSKIIVRFQLLNVSPYIEIPAARLRELADMFGSQIKHEEFAGGNIHTHTIDTGCERGKMYFETTENDMLGLSYLVHCGQNSSSTFNRLLEVLKHFNAYIKFRIIWDDGGKELIEIRDGKFIRREEH